MSDQECQHCGSTAGTVAWKCRSCGAYQLAPERESIPRAIWEGTFKLFGVELRCYVLDDGARIINAEDVAKLFEQMESATYAGDMREGETIPLDSEELQRFARWQRGEG